MKLNNTKRIATEDFPQEDKLLIEKLAFVLNPYLEQITAIFNKNVDFDNLNQEVLRVTVEVDIQGIPKTSTRIKTSLKTRIQGLQCIRADNLENDGTYPTGTPFITWQQSGDLLTIINVASLPANKRYSLTIKAIG